MNKTIISIAIGSLISFSASAATVQNDATEFTKIKNQEVFSELNFDNKDDFESAKRGFIATWPESTIKDENGVVVWDFEKYSFLNGKENIDTINPSLLRQAQLNNEHGLYKVKDGVYQVRGFDLSVMTFLATDSGWVVVDPLISRPVSKAALKIVNDNLGERPIKAVIFTHSHLDHFGGILGVVTAEEVKNGDVEIIAPDGFFEHSITENLMAGNIMSRRSIYQGGISMDIDAKSRIDAGLGKGASTGKVDILKETISIKKTGEEVNIDGLDIEFQMANGSEAPSEFIFYFPKYKTLMASEVMTHTLHNASTLRGAKTRDVLSWAGYIDESIDLFGAKSDTMIASHHWPTWGNENIIDQLQKTRDAYKFIHDTTLHLANKGYTPAEISANIKLPESLSTAWFNRGYYGTVSHNSKAVYDFYFGAWWDGNPANLNVLTPEQEGQKLIESFGEDVVIQKAKDAYDKGDYRWTVTLLNKITFANPDNQASRDLEADAMEQLGYQSESAIWRNYYLTGAKELREGVKEGAIMDSSGIITEMPFKSILDYLTVTLNSDKVPDGTKTLVNINLDNEIYSLDLSNGVLKVYDDRSFENANINITLTKDAYVRMIANKSDLQTEMKAGSFTVDNPEKFKEFMSSFEKFDPWVGIVTP